MIEENRVALASSLDEITHRLHNDGTGRHNVLGAVLPAVYPPSKYILGIS